ncbi:hypothetical protein CEXT_146931 [Caerostris extrusa]|uniref:Uncharacterized protein n=1 Tax=Caerostris extrusa TaxID=172846 RepID=A0AAV4XXL6_CAEEX|nr:hypothetical protein CEXT_146931 [Caerostris extrusa]
MSRERTSLLMHCRPFFLSQTQNKRGRALKKGTAASKKELHKKIVTLTMKGTLTQLELLSYLAVTVILLGFGFCPNLRDMERDFTHKLMSMSPFGKEAKIEFVLRDISQKRLECQKCKH